MCEAGIVGWSRYCKGEYILYNVGCVFPAILFEALVEIESCLPCIDIYDEDCMYSKFNTGN